MHMRATFRFLLALGSIASCVLMAQEHDPRKDRVRIACPGVAAWESTRAHAAPRDQRVATPSDPTLRDELNRMADKDQAARDLSARKVATEGAAALGEVNKVDAENLHRLQQIVKTHGIPTPSLVGDKGMRSFWILAQHASPDPLLQQRVLQALTMDRRGLPLSEIALLTDRVQVNRGEPQTYGTQFHREGGKFVPDTIREPASLAERREKMGLMPMSDYECALEATYAE